MINYPPPSATTGGESKMRNVATTVVLLYFLLAAVPSTAEIKSVKIRSNDHDRMFLDHFEFTDTGHVTISVSSMSAAPIPVTSSLSRPDPSRFGFYLLSDETRDQLYESNIYCDLDSEFISLLFTFQDLEHSFNKSYHVTYPGGYSLYFANCNRLSHVTMVVRTELYNFDNNGTTKDYLSAGITKLPRLYFIFSIIYMCFLGFWMLLCVINHAYVHRIHLLMGALLVTKAISLVCSGEVQHSVKVTGIRSYGWDVLFYIFQFINPTVLYIVIAVIFDGWSFLKRKEAKMVLIIVIPLQALSTLLFKVVGVASIENVPSLSEFGLMIVNIILNVFIIAPMAMSRCYNVNYETDRKDLATLGLCSWFVTVVGGYLLFTNIIFGMSVNNILYTYHWKTNAAEEIISLVFYVVMFLMFMPFEKHGYFVQLKAASAVQNEGV